MRTELKQGITLHLMPTEKFKTNLVGAFLTVPLNREKVTWDSLIPAVLRRGTKEYPTQLAIFKKLEEMYGTEFDCGIEKIGDNHVIKFSMESIGERFLPEKEELLQEQLELLCQIILDPAIKENQFQEDYVTSEKETIRQMIRAKMDNKEQYAVDQCIAAMYQGQPYAFYKYGNSEDLDSITSKDLYSYYLQILQQAKIDIFVSGAMDDKKVEKIVTDAIEKYGIEARTPKYVINNEQTEIKEPQKEAYVEEKMDIAQGKLILGLDIMNHDKDIRYVASLYNVILGESANSKLFQNVREKASLAYSARSLYTKQKSNIFIRCGIEIPNKEKALQIIREQLEDMKQGKFLEEDLENAKRYMLSGIRNVAEEQDTLIMYGLGQELSGSNTSLEEYQEKIQQTTKEQIVAIANQIQINTIYFLTNQE